MPYQLFIKDLETGKIEVDITTDCVMGAYHDAEKDTEDQTVGCGFSLSHCNKQVLATVLKTSKKVQAKAAKDALIKTGFPQALFDMIDDAIGQKRSPIRVVNPDDLK